MTPDDQTQAIFGGFDGLTSALGLIIATAIAGGTKAVIVAAVALAVGASTSMAAGEWLSDRAGNARRAGAMGLATLIGSLAPAVPFLLGMSTPSALMGCAAITVGLGAVIAEARPGPTLRSYVVTFAVLLIATGLAVGTSILAGGAA